MTIEWVHPGLLLIFGAWVIPFLKGPLKRVAMLAIPSAALIVCILMDQGTHGVVSVAGQKLVFGRVDDLSLIFSYVFSIIALVGMVYALHVDDDTQHVSALIYAGAALGVTFAGDFLSLYIFWELMAISSVFLVWRRRDRSAVAAGFRYLLVHVVGGLFLLAGIVIQWSQTGSFEFVDLEGSVGTVGWAFILVPEESCRELPGKTTRGSRSLRPDQAWLLRVPRRGDRRRDRPAAGLSGRSASPRVRKLPSVRLAVRAHLLRRDHRLVQAHRSRVAHETRGPL